MESAAVELDSEGPVFYDEIDVDSLLQGFSDDFADDLDMWLSNSSPVCSTPNSLKEPESPIAAAPSFADELERFLMEDDGHGEAQVEDNGKYLDEFLSGVLVDVSVVGSGSGSGRSEVASPESGGWVDSEAEVKGVRDGVVAIDGDDKEEEEDNDDQISKKRRRQMRNRESAMESRERKKLYVNDLEMKSKYLEAECRRLDYALRCCMAENAALHHQRIQKDGAHASRQESAVLFMESLLLGSLFWLVSAVSLFLVPSLQNPNQKDASRLGGGLALEDAWSKTILTKKPRLDFGLGMVIMRRRCRGLRTRMKAFLFPLHCLSA